MFDPKKDSHRAQGKSLIRVARGPYFCLEGAHIDSSSMGLWRVDVFLNLEDLSFYYSLDMKLGLRVLPTRTLTKTEIKRGLRPTKDWNHVRSLKEITVHEDDKLKPSTLCRTAHKSISHVLSEVHKLVGSPSLGSQFVANLGDGRKEKMRLCMFEPVRMPYPLDEEIRAGIEHYYRWVSSRAQAALSL